jgi:hypothetical protein
MKKIYFIFFFLISLMSKAQLGIKDSIIQFPSVGLHLNAQLPWADMAKRFGFNYAVGGSFCYKTEKNIIWNIDFTYLFGSKVKEADIIQNLYGKDKFIINADGVKSDATVSQRGLYLTAGIGKIFYIPKFSANKNSGLLTQFNIGYLQHKIRVTDISRRTFQINNGYVKGYDRLSAGPAINAFIGYLYFGNNKFINFKIGIDCTVAQTRSLRKFNYDTFMADTQQRFDMLTGIKFEWLLPIYKSSGKDYFYN